MFLEELKDFLKPEREEKKVEYIELIYDLIFVYIIGRNSSLIHNMEGGFIDPDIVLTFIFCTMIAIQIWNITNLFINRYGNNGLIEHILILGNMYLLYFMADATKLHWQDSYFRYNIAWGLILLNIALAYFLKCKKISSIKPWEVFQMKMSITMVLIMAAIVFISLPLYSLTGIPFSPVAMLFGIVFMFATKDIHDLVPVDFGHLSERVMLYIVFTFGEMIIAISGYFEGKFSFNTFYFSLMGFLIVVGLFQTYEIFYDHLLDRELITSGMTYMALHIFIIFALSCITAALEFMREEEVDLLPKIIFLTASFVVYFVFLYLLGIFTKRKARPTKKFILLQIISLAGFAALMILFREHMYINIAFSVLLVFGNLYIIAMEKREYVKACKCTEAKN